LGVHLSAAFHKWTLILRTLILTLLAWTLPLLVAIMMAFFVAVASRGVEILDELHHAGILLTAVLVMLFVTINAVFQDGESLSQRALILRVSLRLGCWMAPLLVAVMVTVFYQHIIATGVTSARIHMAAWLLLAGLYALGYFAASITRERAFRWLGWTNITMAYAALLIFVCLNTPGADPRGVTLP
jgi:hypothetical protein